MPEVDENAGQSLLRQMGAQHRAAAAGDEERARQHGDCRQPVAPGGNGSAGGERETEQQPDQRGESQGGDERRNGRRMGQGNAVGVKGRAQLPPAQEG